jgi:hypothetical protein
METKSARLLALLLTLIMIGSIFAYMGSQSSTVPEREVLFSFPENFKGYLSYLPAGADQVIYVNFNGSDTNMSQILNTIVKNNLRFNFFSKLRLSEGIERMLVTTYPGGFSGIVYLFDVNKSKVFFTHEKEEKYLGFKVKSEKGISLVDQVDPFIIGTSPDVGRVLEIIKADGQGSLGENLKNATDQLPNDDYNLVILMRGNSLKYVVSGNTTDFFDLYISGYRINESENGTFYEKVVVINFTKNAYITKSNKTDYYFYDNLDNGIGIAIMGDKNLTKLMVTEPEMRLVEIQIVNETESNATANQT